MSKQSNNPAKPGGSQSNSPDSFSGQQESVREYLTPLVQEIMHIPTLFVLLGTLAYYAYSSIMVNTVLTTSALSFLLAVIIADTVTGIAYIALKTFGRIRFPVIIGLGISALLLLSLWYCPIGTEQSITAKQALIIGFAQACALLPGISRLAATIVTATWLGLDPLVGALFSLVIELPLILAALGKALLKHPKIVRDILSLSWSRMLILTATSIISCLLLIGVIMLHMQGLLLLFGYYLLAVAMALGIQLYR